MMEIFPAVDIRGGKVVRLRQGDYTRMQIYGDDPLSTARGFADLGARCIHLVDLDGAKEGAPRNRDIIGEIARRTGLFVQTGGGIRTEDAIGAYVDAGVGRVILGTAALDEAFLRDMLARFGDAIAVGVDARGGRVAVRGWLEDSGLDALDFCAKLAHLGVCCIIYTDIDRDGMLMGANLQIYKELNQIPGLKVVASGGIADISEIRALGDMGVYGAILGRALYEGRIDLAQALDIAGGRS